MDLLTSTGSIGGGLRLLRVELEELRREGLQAAKSRARELEAASLDAETQHGGAVLHHAIRILRSKCRAIEAGFQLMKFERERGEAPLGAPTQGAPSGGVQAIPSRAPPPGLEPIQVKVPPTTPSAEGAMPHPSASLDACMSNTASSDASPDACPAPIACSEASMASSSSRCASSGSNAMQPTIHSTFDCPICLGKKAIEDVFLVDSCQHQMCRECAREMILKVLRSGKVPVGCPSCQSDACPKCPEMNAETQSQEHNRCSLSQGDVETVLTEEEFLRYLSATLDASINTSGGTLVRCPEGDCSGVLEIPDDRANFTCPVCSQQWCRNCGVEWHQNLTCAQFQRGKSEAEDETVIQMVQAGRIKRCPRCQKHGMKDEVQECNATQCQMCKCNFCWLCLKDLSGYSDVHSHFAEPGPCFGKCFYGLPGHENTS